VCSSDLVGQLSRAFDKMTADLKHTTASIDRLNREIAARKEIENDIKKIQKQQQDINELQQLLLAPGVLENKIKVITDGIVRIFNADFCRIWLIRPGDLCDQGCVHAGVKEGPHVCRFRDKCLHLLASSGTYTHIDGKIHRRVPFDCYKIGRVASGKDHRFLTNDVPNDPRVHDHEWAHKLALVSFAGYQIRIPGGETMGVLALFAKHPILPAEDALLDSLSSTVAFVVQQSASQEKLSKTAAEWETTFNSIPDLISIYDKDYRIAKVNKAFADFFKMKPEEVVGKFCYEVIHGTDKPYPGCPHKKTMETGKPSVSEFFEPKLGIYVEASASPVFDDNKNIIGTVHIIKNITERKKTDIALRQLANIVESSDDAIIGKSLDGVITSWNKGAERLYGYTEKEVVGKNVSVLIPEEYAEGLRAINEKIAKGLSVERLETMRQKKDGTKFYVSLTISPIKDNDGNIVGASTIAHDITERKKTEELLRRYNEELEKAVDARTSELRASQDKLVRSEKMASIGKLASSVAHELRNPLGVMKNVVYYLNMLGLSKENPEVKENLDIITQEIENSDKIIADLLEFSRAKNPVLRPENINLIVREVLSRLRIEPNIELVLDLKDGLPDIAVDALQMHQIFYNLIKNALEAMEQGGKLKITTAHEGEFIEAAVSDTGGGISEENLAKIFEPLFSTKTKGTGLGLSICASLVERHEGKLEVKSEAGKGTTFTVKLPVKRG
ncbi:MAG: PAS domain S-box protein, partial [Candidatus Omnitrophica bacterium]|nr:PAS domain S-box protein [Candidatus Omnitrophota bacterium]